MFDQRFVTDPLYSVRECLNPKIGYLVAQVDMVSDRPGLSGIAMLGVETRPVNRNKSVPPIALSDKNFGFGKHVKDSCDMK
jgi:hypothetical protein